jgi:hypothetical protein
MDEDDNLLYEEFDKPMVVLPEVPSHSIITHKEISGVQSQFIGEFHHFQCYKDTLRNIQPRQAFVPLYKAIRDEKIIYFVIQDNSVIYILNNAGIKYYYDYYLKYHTRIYPFEFYNTISNIRDHKYNSKLSPYNVHSSKRILNDILDDFLSYLDLHFHKDILGGKTRRRRQKKAGKKSRRKTRNIRKAKKPSRRKKI